MATADDDAPVTSVASHEDVLEFWFDGDVDVSARQCPGPAPPTSEKPPPPDSPQTFRPSVRPSPRAHLTCPRPTPDHASQENYKRKWFPAGDRTGEMQKRVDDAISHRFGATLAAAERGDLDAWADASPSHAVALVVTLDQFSRHVYRHAPDRDARVAKCDAKCVGVVQTCVERGWDARVPTPQQVFLLMPFRHTQKDLPRLRLALERLDARRETEAQCADLLAKFRRTTLRCLQDLEGKQHVDGDDILEFHEFEPQPEVLRSMPSHPVYRTVESFLRRKLIEEHDVHTERVAEERPRSVAISLSGGVDSMVLATTLKAAAPSFGDFDVVAMHIDYANRPESGKEADFVRGWCERKGIVCVVRRIAEVKRGVTPREQYEAESRAIRYGLYKECAKTHGFPAVFVGHHEGDVQENIIANIFRGANVLGMNGMNEEGVVEGVRIWRPMLPHSKDPVLDFAHTFGVPYFLDTTPTWSTRGKLRNQLLPLLADMFGDGFLRNLSLLGEDSAQLGRMVEDSVLGPFSRRMRLSDSGAYADFSGDEDKPMLFWKEALKRMCHGLGSGMMKERSVRELIDRFTLAKRRVAKDGWITLKKLNKTFVTGKTLGMFASEFFPHYPWTEKSAWSEPVGTTVGLDAAEPTRVGPWTITARVVPNSREGVAALLESAAPLDVWAILRNEITYLLPLTDTHAAPGAYYVDTKARIPPLRGVDAQVARALPLVVPAGLGGVSGGDGVLEVGGSIPGGGGGGDGFRAKSWPPSLLRGEMCVEVTLRFVRTRSHAVDGEE